MIEKRADHFLSLIIPIYKQEKTIIENLRRIRQVLENIRYDYEIIAAVDGKIDASFSRIKRAKIPKIRVLLNKINQGKFAAIRRGMKKAKGDYVMFLDAGEEIDPNGISMLLEHMEWYNADIIVGSKRHPASFVEYPLMRQILSWGYYYLVKILFGVKVRDTQAGIKIFRAAVLKKILPRLMEKKFAGDLEILVVARQFGFKRQFEAPIKLNGTFANVSSAATWRSIIRIFIDTMAIFYRAYVINYYVKKISN